MGKKRLFFPILLGSFILTNQGLHAQNLDALFSSLMNFHRFRIITLEELKKRPSEIRSLLVINDFYRKQVNGASVLTWDGAVWKIDAFIPWSGTRFQFGINLIYHASQRWFQNKKDRTALYIKNHTTGHHGGFQLAITDGTGLLGAGFEGYSTQFQTPIWIKDFPRSKNSAMRKFFLDWVEPTFGQRLDITGHSEFQKPILFASIPAFQRNRLTLFFAHSYFSSRPETFYFNSSNKPELAGNRKIDVIFENQENILDISLVNKKASSKISTTLFDSRFTFYLDNNPPQTSPILLDYEKLGNGKGGRSGFSIRYSKESKKYLFQIGLGKCHYFGKLDIKTPVLGYYEGIFPISHGLKGRIVGNSFSQIVEGGFTKTIFSALSFLKVGYTHGFFDLKVDGDALLEFGLVSVPVHHPLQYHVHIVEINWRLEKHFGPLATFYSFSQFIPYIVRSDTSPIRLTEKVPEVTTKSRGGGVHQFVVSYQW